MTGQTPSLPQYEACRYCRRPLDGSNLVPSGMLPPHDHHIAWCEHSPDRAHHPMTAWDRIDHQVISSYRVPPVMMSEPQPSSWQAPSQNYWVPVQAHGAGGSGGEYAAEPGVHTARAMALEYGTRGVAEPQDEQPEPYIEHRANFIDTGDLSELEAMKDAYAAAWPRDPRPPDEIEHENEATAPPARRPVPEPVPAPWYDRKLTYAMAWGAVAVLLGLAVIILVAG